MHFGGLVTFCATQFDYVDYNFNCFEGLQLKN
jgi:hypothetical protein